MRMPHNYMTHAANVELLRLLGRVQWLSRAAMLALFMAGAYQASYHGTAQFGRAPIC